MSPREDAIALGWDESLLTPTTDVVLVHADTRFLAFARPDQVVEIQWRDATTGKTLSGTTLRKGCAMTTLREPSAECVRAAGEWWARTTCAT